MKKLLVAILDAMTDGIDEIDTQLIRLVSHRFELCKRRAESKKESGLLLIDREREALDIDRKRTLLGSQFGISPDFIGQLLKKIEDEGNRHLV